MDPDASEPLGPGATASAVTPSLWRRIVATGDKPEPRPPASTVAASWIRTAVSAAEAVTTCCPLGPQEAEQSAGEPALCASRSFTTRPFMAALRFCRLGVSAATRRLIFTSAGAWGLRPQRKGPATCVEAGSAGWRRTPSALGRRGWMRTARETRRRRRRANAGRGEGGNRLGSRWGCDAGGYVCLFRIGTKA